MTAVFADTFFYLALMNSHDAAHRSAAELLQTISSHTVTTIWVMTEVGDALAKSRHRVFFPGLLRVLNSDSKTTIVLASQELFDSGVNFYARRADKQWSLTDCISFVVMHEHGLTDALTGDHHFEQAGFNILLG